MALTAESEAALVASPNGKLDEVTYQAGKGPVEVRVVDPLSVPNAEFELRVFGEAGDLDEGEDVEWVLTNLTMLDTAVTPTRPSHCHQRPHHRCAQRAAHPGVGPRRHHPPASV